MGAAQWVCAVVRKLSPERLATCSDAKAIATEEAHVWVASALVIAPTTVKPAAGT